MGTGEGATFGPELSLSGAVVMVVVVDRMRLGFPVGCGFLGQSVLVAVDAGSHERLPWGRGYGPVSTGVQWH